MDCVRAMASDEVLVMRSYIIRMARCASAPIGGFGAPFDAPPGTAMLNGQLLLLHGQPLNQ
jgi:hypothetical protein